ncbi:hypothetical protein NP493_258g06066 [Ridgeia piscesae]|uniref:N(4)-(beta-N-acetylglucosaminyl)-L-asparaginase n=1 Tax=Ridgeia piscesae TaxID=27915 RepID=A0AAD9NY86_RIDPI|nr:hypothetical protein NP493_258g06066 [Ridgeia piscesae]
MRWLVLLLALFGNCLYYSNGNNVRLPFVINTWPFKVATKAAWEAVKNESSSALDAVVAGCSACERHQCDGTVGYGGSPDENGETTLDSMVMDGLTHDVGAVAGLRFVKDAAAVARAVLKYTKHTLLAGELATDFAVDMGFKRTNLQTNVSREIWKSWRQRNCQPNYWQNDVSPNPKKTCGPYKPYRTRLDRERYNRNINEDNHDTVGILVIDHHGNMAVGTSTNGATHKIPGRVGDSPIMGAGAYVDNSVGGAAATGDGDVMMRFLPSFHTVALMEAGLSPTQACKVALSKITKYYPKFSGALIAATVSGEYGAACHGFQTFPYCVQSGAAGGQLKVFNVTCT